MYLKVVAKVDEIKDWPVFPSKQRAVWMDPLSFFMEDQFNIDRETAATVFNVASGTRHASVRLNELFPKFTIWDFDIAEIPLEQRFENFIQTDYHHLPVEAETADFLFCFFGFDYSRQPQVVAEEWRRVLRDAGIAFIALHSPFSNIVSRLDLFSLSSTKEILEAYEKKDFELFYSKYEFYFYNVSIIKKLVTLEEKYLFLKSYYEVSNYLLNNKKNMFNSPTQINSFFEQAGFKRSTVQVIQHDGRLKDIADKTDYTQPNYDGWFVILEK
jgi:ubiquinone/menaquinone biosynthesis C-methylase UbiE